ncbi:RluA family pseudouridine synthase [Bacillus oleivorans]|uniref:Pseudouridine synthase n=1 Tax=Bacillus oleivorans TaxID=1448271 RepID=A0A285CQW3_9BACI|nr:RluA family pseudouridine synthase [Bacillus oleivorans]SNX69937.1 RluA family pseudouridine synthase [Bacillus oleivorans]
MRVDRQGPYLILPVKAEWEGLTLQDIFKKKWMLPKKLVHQWRMDRAVLINGDDHHWNTPCNKGDRLKIKVLEDQEFLVAPIYADIDILFEDDHCMAVNKPPHMKTHPTEEKEETTLLHAVSFHVYATGEKRKVRPIHRLDRDTTGAVLFSKHELAGVLLDERLTKKEVHRTYWAVVDGIPSQNKGTINEPIGRDRHHPTRRRVSPGGQSAITLYQVLESSKKKNRSLIQCTLETGRTHQIRVHLSSIGHPLVGDQLYGGSSDFYRPALHGIQLSFIHPLLEENITVKAPFLDDMINLLK